MNRTRCRIVVLALALLAAAGRGTALGAHGGSRSRAQRELTAINRLISAVNSGNLSATSRLFTSTAVLQVSKRQLRGNRTVTQWWRGELAHHLQIALESQIRTGGSGADAVIRRTTRGGDCPNNCWERASWRFQGARFSRMTLVTTAHPPLPNPEPLRTVPPPPKAPPPPNVTPTIPT